MESKHDVAADPDEPVIAVLIADDHGVVREGLRALINSEPGMRVIAEARNGKEAVMLARSSHPDVLLLDLKMPEMDGLAAIAEIKKDDADARILVLTSFDRDEEIFAAIKSGALGYLLKETSPERLLRAIREVHRGESSLHPSVARKLIGEMHKEKELPAASEQLSERELQVLRLVATGISNQEIANQLFVSERTVRNHVSAILGKLHLANRTQAALYALREGLAKLDRT